MADKKISELDAITGSNTAATDVFVVVDTSTGQTKKITREELNNAIEQDVLSSIDIDTINGDFSVNGNINLGDNDKAIFGAGSDLQIYHDGSNSFIHDNGSGRLYLKANDGVLIQGNNNETLGRFIQDGAVQLYFNGSQKLATTSTGIDVTGTVTADGLTVEGTATTRPTIGNSDVNTSGLTTGLNFKPISNIGDGAKLNVISGLQPTVASAYTAGFEFVTHDWNGTTNTQTKALTIGASGDISFYEDTGTTAKLFWDASAENLGLGTTSPDRAIKIHKDNAYVWIADAAGGNVAFMGGSGENDGLFRLYEGGGHTAKVEIHSDADSYFNGGNVGIGTSSPDSGTPLHVARSSSTIFHYGEKTSGSTAGIAMADTNGSAQILSTDGNLRFKVDGDASTSGTNSAEAMRIDSAGRVGIGTSSPDCDFHIAGSSVASLRFGNIGTSANSALRISRDDTSVINNNPLGFLEFGGNDSTSNIDAAFAYIGGVADGTHAAGSNATRLEFATTPSGSSTPVERLRIDSSGRVGVGTTSAVDRLHLHSTAAETNGIRLSNSATGSTSSDGFQIYAGSTGQAVLRQRENDSMVMMTNNTERMRIDSSGNLAIAKTVIDNTTEGYHFGNGSYAAFVSDASRALLLNRLTSTGEIVAFRQASTTVGTISVTGSATAYNTSSDYRLKENVTGITDGIERVKQLNPSRFNFIADADTTVDGFLAHEAATVVPESVTGEKDAVDADGNPEYQGIDQAKLVPLLTAALQEAITKIEDLEARVATLEGN